MITYYDISKIPASDLFALCHPIQALSNKFTRT